MKRLLFLLLAGFHIVLTNTQQPKLCIDVNKECEETDLSCALAFLQFKVDCPHIMGTQMDPTIQRNCSSKCMAAINLLNSTEKGAAFYTCNCNLDGHCLTLKARIAKCFVADNGVTRKPSCTMTMINCFGNGRCSKLNTDFLDDCNDMINGVRCEKKCLKTQSELMEHELGKPFYSCECDGPAEPDCRGLQAHAVQLRCLPGMDGSGSRLFDYQNTDTIHGAEEDLEEDGGNSAIITRPYVLPWALVLLLSLIII